MKLILQKVLSIIHVIAGLLVALTYLLFMKMPFFNDLALNLIMAYAGSGILYYLLFRRELLGWRKTYFQAISLLVICYVGLWVILLPLIMH